MDRTKILDQLVRSRTFRATSLRLVDRLIDLAEDGESGELLHGDTAILIATGRALRLVDEGDVAWRRETLVAAGEVIWRRDLLRPGASSLIEAIRVEPAGPGAIPTGFRFITVEKLAELSTIWPDFHPLANSPEIGESGGASADVPWISILLKVDGNGGVERSQKSVARMGEWLVHAFELAHGIPGDAGATEEAVLVEIREGKTDEDGVAQLRYWGHQPEPVSFRLPFEWRTGTPAEDNQRKLGREVEVAALGLVGNPGPSETQRFLIYVMYDEGGMRDADLAATFPRFDGLVAFLDRPEHEGLSLDFDKAALVHESGWIVPTRVIGEQRREERRFRTSPALRDESDDCRGSMLVGPARRAPQDQRLLQRNMCRLAFDPRSIAETPSEAQMQSLDRWLRAILFRRVGVALSGGGASAFRFVPLLSRLMTGGPNGSEGEGPPCPTVPIDVIAGVSGGALVAAYVCAEGAKGLSMCRKEGRAFQRCANVASIAPSLFRRHIDNSLDNRRVEDLEVRFVAQTTALWGGGIEAPEARYVTHGSLGEAVQVSGALPLAFGPAKFDDVLYGDGALTANVPARMLKEHGADLVIALNAVPGPAVPAEPWRDIPIVSGFIAAIVGTHNLIDRAQDADRRAAELFFETCSTGATFLFESSFFGGSDSIAREEEVLFGERWREAAILCRRNFDEMANRSTGAGAPRPAPSKKRASRRKKTQPVRQAKPAAGAARARSKRSKKR